MIQNAISYGTSKTPVDITIGEIPNYTVIKVKDHGAGISEKEIEKILSEEKKEKATLLKERDKLNKDIASLKKKESQITCWTPPFIFSM